LKVKLKASVFRYQSQQSSLLIPETSVISDHQQAGGYEDGLYKGPGPPLGWPLIFSQSVKKISYLPNQPYPYCPQSKYQFFFIAALDLIRIVDVAMKKQYSGCHVDNNFRLLYVELSFFAYLANGTYS